MEINTSECQEGGLNERYCRDVGEGMIQVRSKKESDEYELAHGGTCLDGEGFSFESESEKETGTQKSSIWPACLKSSIHFFVVGSPLEGLFCRMLPMTLKCL